MTPAPPSPPAPSAVHPIGRQSVCVHGNLVEANLDGIVTEAEISDLCALYDRVVAEYGHACLLSNLQHGQSIDPKARRIAVEWARRNALRYHCALSGGSRTMRALATLLTGAIRMVSGQHVPVALFDTAEQARRWLAPYHIHAGPPGPAVPDVSGPPP